MRHLEEELHGFHRVPDFLHDGIAAYFADIDRRSKVPFAAMRPGIRDALPIPMVDNRCIVQPIARWLSHAAGPARRRSQNEMSLRLSHRRSAIGENVLASHPFRFLRNEKRHDRSNIFWLTDAIEGRCASGHLFQMIGSVSEHARRGRTRYYGVDRNALRTELLGEHLCDCANRHFRRCISIGKEAVEDDTNTIRPPSDMRSSARCVRKNGALALRS